VHEIDASRVAYEFEDVGGTQLSGRGEQVGAMFCEGRVAGIDDAVELSK
jgi:hypothetical protein